MRNVDCLYLLGSFKYLLAIVSYWRKSKPALATLKKKTENKQERNEFCKNDATIDAFLQFVKLTDNNSSCEELRACFFYFYTCS